MAATDRKVVTAEGKCVPRVHVADVLVRIDNLNSIAVTFEILPERYFRPLVVLLYYVCYKATGTWGLPYHVAVVLRRRWRALLSRWLDAAEVQRSSIPAPSGRRVSCSSARNEKDPVNTGPS